MGLSGLQTWLLWGPGESLRVARSRPPFHWAACSQPFPPRRQPGSLEEVVLAVDTLPAAEAALGQRRVAVAALEAPAVPVAVQSLEDEAVQDVLVAASTQGDLCRQRSHQWSWTPHREGEASPSPASSRDRGCQETPFPAHPLPRTA